MWGKDSVSFCLSTWHLQCPLHPKADSHRGSGWLTASCTFLLPGGDRRLVLAFKQEFEAHPGLTYLGPMLNLPTNDCSQSARDCPWCWWGVGERRRGATSGVQGLCGETNLGIILERREEWVMQQQISIIGMMWFGNCKGLCIWKSSDLSYVFPKSK